MVALVYIIINGALTNFPSAGDLGSTVITFKFSIHPADMSMFHMRGRLKINVLHSEICTILLVGPLELVFETTLQPRSPTTTGHKTGDDVGVRGREGGVSESETAWTHRREGDVTGISIVCIKTLMEIEPDNAQYPP